MHRIGVHDNCMLLIEAAYMMQQTQVVEVGNIISGLTLGLKKV